MLVQPSTLPNDPYLFSPVTRDFLFLRLRTEEAEAEEEGEGEAEEEEGKEE